MNLLAVSLLFTASLASCGNTSDRVVIFTTAEEERINYLQNELNEQFPNIDIEFQYLGNGNMVSKFQAEGTETEADIFYDFEVTNAEIVLNSNPAIFADLSSYDFSIYDSSVTGYLSSHKNYAVDAKLDGGVLVNKKVLESKGLSVPHSYSDLLDEKYKGLISMPNPKSSGTGYCFYNGLVATKGESEALNYFSELDKNVKEFTSSGSAPIKSVDRGDVAVGFGMLWQCVQFANNNSDLEVVILDEKAPYNLYSMGMISGHDTKQNVKSVFDYLYNDLNKKEVAAFTPDKIYVEQPQTTIANYPQNVQEIDMVGVFDPKHKQNLLDKWTL